MPARHIVVEGPIAVGKTTLAGRLAQALQARLVLEEPHENPYLPEFYADPDSAALPTQLYFLLQRVRQHQHTRASLADNEVSVWDYFLDKDPLFADMTLNEQDLGTYRTVFSRLVGELPRPDLVIYLRAPAPVLLSRLRERARGYERDVGEDYLARLSRYYEAYFARYDAAPVVTLDTEAIDFARDTAAVERLVAGVLARLRGD